MTTTTYYTGADISKDTVYEGINSYTASSDISEEDMHTLLRKITSEVNEQLPEDFAWEPQTSNIICDITTEQELDIEWVKELISAAIGKYVDEYDEQHMEEGEK